MQRKIFSKAGRGPFSSEFFYTKGSDIIETSDASMFTKSRRLKMHKKDLTLRIRARNDAVEKISKKSNELTPMILKLASSGKPLSPTQKKILKFQVVSFLKTLEFAMQQELQFINRKSLKPSSAFGGGDRMHAINNAELGVIGSLEMLETTGIVDGGFRQECINEAGYVSRSRKPAAKKPHP